MQARWMSMMVVIAGLFTGGCDDPAPEKDELADAKAVCAYDPFEATVREGPSAGLAAKGALTLIEEEGGSLRGKLESKDAAGGETEIEVMGAVAEGSIELTFTLADGGQIHGEGALAKAFSECPDPIIGDLTGPKSGDKGDWGGYGSRCFNDCRLIGGGFTECLVGCALFY